MAYQYIKARKHSGAQKRIDRIVIHCTVSPTGRGWARKIANYFQSPSAGGSAHYVVDAGEIVQCLPDDVIAWHAPPNSGSIGIELCDWQKGKASRWQDDEHQSMLRLAAPLVRRLAEKYDVPLVWISPAGLKAGHRGICGHVDVSRAWGQTDHGDPNMGGLFPKIQFMNMIGDAGDELSAEDVIHGKHIVIDKGEKGAEKVSLAHFMQVIETDLDEMKKEIKELKALLKAKE